jgi:hypothetical protein
MIKKLISNRYPAARSGTTFDTIPKQAIGPGDRGGQPGPTRGVINDHRGEGGEVVIEQGAKKINLDMRSVRCGTLG